MSFLIFAHRKSNSWLQGLRRGTGAGIPVLNTTHDYFHLHRATSCPGPSSPPFFPRNQDLIVSVPCSDATDGSHCFLDHVQTPWLRAPLGLAPVELSGAISNILLQSQLNIGLPPNAGCPPSLSAHLPLSLEHHAQPSGL